MARSSTASTPAPSSRKKTKAPKPSVEYVEIDSEDERQRQKPSLKGVLRDLDPNSILESTATSQDVLERRQHATRTSRYGRSSATALKYDAKYHPLDEASRPTYAANRRARLHSTLGLSSPPPHDFSRSSETPESTSEAQEETDAETSDNEPLDQTEPPLRKPDPRASRRSSRPEARKLVYYSKSHHPQDYGIPGHQHKARQLKRLLKVTESSLQKSSKRKRHDNSSSEHERSSTKRHKASDGRSEAPTLGEADDDIEKIMRGDHIYSNHSDTVKADGTAEMPIQVTSDHADQDEDEDDDDPSADLDRLVDDHVPLALWTAINHASSDAQTDDHHEEISASQSLLRNIDGDCLSTNGDTNKQLCFWNTRQVQVTEAHNNRSAGTQLPTPHTNGVNSDPVQYGSSYYGPRAKTTVCWNDLLISTEHDQNAGSQFDNHLLASDALSGCDEC